MNGALARVLVRLVSMLLIVYGTLGSATPQIERFQRAGPLPASSSLTLDWISVRPASSAARVTLGVMSHRSARWKRG